MVHIAGEAVVEKPHQRGASAGRAGRPSVGCRLVEGKERHDIAMTKRGGKRGMVGKAEILPKPQDAGRAVHGSNTAAAVFANILSEVK